jgi:hypothetical protein
MMVRIGHSPHEGQAADDLDLAKKLVTANPIIARETELRAKEIIRRDGAGRMQILPARDIAGAHGKTYLSIAGVLAGELRTRSRIEHVRATVELISQRSAID